LPLAWSTILAVGALLINDSSTAGPLIAGQGTIANLLGGLLLALAGLASLWLCIRAAREAGAVLRGQLGGTLMIGRAGSRATASSAPAPARRAGESLRGFPGRVARASGAALTAAGPTGAAVATGASAFAQHTRHGVIGAGGALIRTGAGAAAPGTAALVGRTRAGAAAVRMARAGTANWQASAPGGQASAASSGPAHPRRTGPGVHVPSTPGGRDTSPAPSPASGAVPSGRPVHASPPVGAPGRGEPSGRSAAVPQSASRAGPPQPTDGKARGGVDRPQRTSKAPEPRAPRRPRPRKGK
jgi:hypothetical protein